MKIAFDAQLLFEEEKTGIGWYISKLIENAVLNDENEYYLNYFSFRKQAEKLETLKPYMRPNVRPQVCSWMPLGLSKKIEKFAEIPYGSFMPKDVDITQFFHYKIPKGAKGLKGVVIYDMVWRRYPETMSDVVREDMDRTMLYIRERADFIITISEFSKKEIAELLPYPEEKIFVVPCGVDFDRFYVMEDDAGVEAVKQKYDISGDYILYLGTLEPRKNIENLIRAYHIYLSQNKDTNKHEGRNIQNDDSEKNYDSEAKQKVISFPKLVIAGKKGWKYESIMELVRELRLDDQVVFTGYVANEDVTPLINGASLFAFPSLYEGFGMPPLEAMACGTPVLVSNTSSLPEVVEDAGVQVDCKSPESIAEGMMRVLEDKAFRAELKSKGLLQARKFRWESSAQKLNETYDNLMRSC